MLWLVLNVKVFDEKEVSEMDGGKEVRVQMKCCFDLEHFAVVAKF